MKTLKKYFIIATVMLVSVLAAKTSYSQVFYIGFNGSSVYSWFNSPKLENVITSDGWGWDLGFFLRYGRRPFVQIGLDWTRSANDVTVKFYDDELQEEQTYEETIKLNNFDFSVLVGYELLQTPMFKISVRGGPFIGKSLMFSGETFYFENSDFKNPQWGVTAGLGFQFTNLIFGIKYNYHFTELFKPVVIDNVKYKFGSKIQMISLNVGLMF